MSKITVEEFAAASHYAQRLWQSWKPTVEELDVWFARLQHFTLDEVRRGMADAYAESRYATPRLCEVVDKIRAARRGQVGINATKGEMDRWKLDRDPNPRPLSELLPKVKA